MYYFNQAATSYPKPKEVLNCYIKMHNEIPAGQFRSSGRREVGDILENCRKRIGRLFGISDTRRIYFTSGATEAANLIIQGLRTDGKRIAVTELEHNSILRPMYNCRREELKLVPCNEEGYIEADKLMQCLSDDVGFLFLNHCSNVTGTIQNLDEICRITSDRDVRLILDVSQSGGCIPVSVDKYGIDGLIFTGHKGLMGLQGTGGCYIGSRLHVRPLKYGGTGTDSRRLLYTEDVYEYEAGTQNLPGIAALDQAVELILKTGVETIFEKENAIINRLHDALQRIPGVTVYGTKRAADRGPLLSFTLDGMDPSDLAYILDAGYEMVVRTGLHCAPLIHRRLGTQEKGTVRVSVGYQTGEEELEKLIDAVDEISREAAKNRQGLEEQG